MSKPGSLVLFDIDGTLMRGAGPRHKQALIEGIRRVTGLITDLDGVATAGMLDRDLIAGMLRARGQTERRIRATLRRAMEESQAAYMAGEAGSLIRFVCPSVPELLTSLKSRGAVLGLVTGNLSGIGWAKMELAGLRPYFSVGAFAEDGRTRTQLARRAARRAIREGLVSRRCRVALIGDHPNDIAAAKANGFTSVAVATGLSTWEELAAAEPDVLVQTMAELDLDLLVANR